MRYFIRCLCRNCKWTFEIDIDEIDFEEKVHINRVSNSNCYYHQCYSNMKLKDKEITEIGVADTIAFCKENEK